MTIELDKNKLSIVMFAVKEIGYVEARLAAAIINGDLDCWEIEARRVYKKLKKELCALGLNELNQMIKESVNDYLSFAKSKVHLS